VALKQLIFESAQAIVGPPQVEEDLLFERIEVSAARVGQNHVYTIYCQTIVV
jgi:hypothetical protein